MQQVQLPPNLATEAAPAPSRAAEKQVTAVDILSEAQDSRAAQYQRPKQSIQDLEELRSFQLAKRRDYEQQLNKNRLNYPQWMRYARWELEHNQDFRRFRSIMERALEVDAKHVPFWVRYIELELLHQNVNHGRNLLERAVGVLPRVDKLWYMYVQTEESIGNFRGVRQVFERWLSWKPEGHVWDTYVAFELRYNEEEHVRSLYLRYVAETGSCAVWRKWVLFETGLVATDEQVARTRGVFEAAVDYVAERETETETETAEPTKDGPKLIASGVAAPPNANKASTEVVSLILLWINWELSQREVERARCIYQKVVEAKFLTQEEKVHLLDQLDFAAMDAGGGLHSESAATQRRLRLQQQLAANERDYDTWWEYAKLVEQTEGRRCMQVLADAVATVPLEHHKSVAWRRYVFLWIKRALYSEYYVQDAAHARELWQQARAAVPPHMAFAKLWVHSAEYELRHGGVPAYRRTMGAAIGRCCSRVPKAKIFKVYIGFELALGEYARVRKLYEKWAELAVACDAQTGSHGAVAVLQQYIAFEKELGESERAMALYDIALRLTGAALLPEYVEFLKDEFRYDAARDVLRGAAGDAAGWVRLALFESSILTADQMDQLQAGDGELRFEVGDEHVAATRAVFEQGYRALKAAADGQGANQLLDSWSEYERSHGSEQHADAAEKKRPQQVARRRVQDGVEQIHYEYEFPETKPDLSKFLANARKWKAAA